MTSDRTARSEAEVKRGHSSTSSSRLLPGPGVCQLIALCDTKSQELSLTVPECGHQKHRSSGQGSVVVYRHCPRVCQLLSARSAYTPDPMGWKRKKTRAIANRRGDHSCNGTELFVSWFHTGSREARLAQSSEAAHGTGMEIESEPVMYLHGRCRSRWEPDGPDQEAMFPQ